MTSSSDDPRLPKRAETLLGAMHGPARSDDGWEEQVSSVLAKLDGAAIGSTPDELLAPPALEADEPDRERSEQSLRAPAPLGEPRRTTTRSRRPRHEDTARPGPSFRWLLGGVLGLAAAAYLVVRVHDLHPAAREAQKVVVTAPAAERHALRPPVPQPVTNAAPAPAAPASVAAVSPPPSLSRSAQKPARTKRAIAAPDAAELPENDRLVPADGREPITEHPSPGALLAAMSPVLPVARRCLTGEKSPISAQIVFSSDGRVKNVEVAPGARAEVAACVRVALAGARLSPFAKNTWSVRQIVRPP